MCVWAGVTVEQFEQAKSKLSTLKKDPGNEVKLKIYALFKQVGRGPGGVQVVRGLGPPSVCSTKLYSHRVSVT